MPTPEKAKSLLYIPYHSLKFNHFQEKLPCMQVPMYFTATSGMALLKGLPNAECTQTLGAYGYSYYNYEGRDKAWQSGYSILEAQALAIARGFQFLWYYDKRSLSFQKKD